MTSPLDSIYLARAEEQSARACITDVPQRRAFFCCRFPGCLQHVARYSSSQLCQRHRSHGRKR